MLRYYHPVLHVSYGPAGVTHVMFYLRLRMRNPLQQTAHYRCAVVDVLPTIYVYVICMHNHFEKAYT